MRYLSIDPTIRTWMDDAPGYLPPIELGDDRAGRREWARWWRRTSDRYAVGDLVFGLTGWQDYTIADEGAAAMQVIPPGIDPPLVLSVLGVTGMTAYFGMIDVGRVADGRHRGRVRGRRSHGIGRRADRQDQRGRSGGRHRRDTPRSARGSWTSSASTRRSTTGRDDVAGSLRRLCPDGIDLYYDNVGGEILDTCLAQLAMRGRIVLCGAISVYNEQSRPPGPRNIFNLIVKRGRMEGFLVLDYLDRFLEAQIDMVGWMAEGKVKHAEHLVDGLERAPEALNLLFTGGNTGKVIVKL